MKGSTRLVGMCLLALAIWISCRPAWHPSGKLVAFSFGEGLFSPEGEAHTGIALYDTQAKSVTRLVDMAGTNFVGAQCVWSHDGKSLLIAAEGDEPGVIAVTRIDPASGAATQPVATIEGLSVPTAVGAPLILSGDDRYLWVGYLYKDNSCFYGRVDLSNNRVSEYFNSANTETCLFDFSGRGYRYVRATAGKKRAPGKVQVGVLDVTNGSLSQSAELPDAPGCRWDSLVAEMQGTRFAAPVSSEGAFAIRVISDKFQSIKDIPLSAGTSGVGGLAWCGKFIFAGATRVDKGQKELGLFKVDVETGQLQFLSLGPAEEPGQKSTGAEQSLQPSVSPDGKWLAVAGICLKKQTAGRPTALVLIDLAASESAPVFVALPPKSSAPAGS